MIIRIILYLILLVVFYGFSNNYGYNLKPDKVKVITTIIIAVTLLPIVLYKI